MKLTTKELIVVHVCYRNVFNAPVSMKSLKLWLGITNVNHEDFDNSISELVEEGLIIKKDDYLAITDKEELINRQLEKNNLAAYLIREGKSVLSLLGKLPMIRFIGISGSLAASNPVKDTKGVNKGKVDLDVFIITSKNSLWLFILIERLYTNVRRLIKGSFFYDFNYVTDESFLEVYNKNFYTATEIVNVIPIVNKGIYKDFLARNHWYTNYYFDSQINILTTKKGGSKNYFSNILWLPNFISFSLFCIFRAIKRLDMNALKEISTKYNPINKCNLMRISNAAGGYQKLILIKFENQLRQYFSFYYSPELVKFLFPSESSFRLNAKNIPNKEFTEYMDKYQTISNAKGSI